MTCTIGEGRESISADSFVVTITTKIKSRERPTRKYELKEREREREKKVKRDYFMVLRRQTENVIENHRFVVSSRVSFIVFQIVVVVA